MQVVYGCKFLLSIIGKNRHKKRVPTALSGLFYFMMINFMFSKPLKKRSFSCNKNVPYPNPDNSLILKRYGIGYKEFKKLLLQKTLLVKTSFFFRVIPYICCPFAEIRGLRSKVG
jgi:hypothetical protein